MPVYSCLFFPKISSYFHNLTHFIMLDYVYILDNGDCHYKSNLLLLYFICGHSYKKKILGFHCCVSNYVPQFIIIAFELTLSCFHNRQ